MENFCDKLDEKGFPKYTTGICLRALQELLKSRRLLAYSCAFSYYMKHEQSRNIFDDNVEVGNDLSSFLNTTFSFWKAIRKDFLRNLLELLRSGNVQTIPSLSSLIWLIFKTKWNISKSVAKFCWNTQMNASWINIANTTIDLKTR